MTRHLSRDHVAVLAGLLAPLAVAAILLPWRASWSNTNVALLLVVASWPWPRSETASPGRWRRCRRVGLVRFLLHPALRAVHHPRLSRPHHGAAAAGGRPGRLAAGGAGPAAAGRRDHRRRLSRPRSTRSPSLAKSRGRAGTVVDSVREQLISVLDLEGCRFEYGSLLGHPPRLEPDGTVVTGHGRWDVEHVRPARGGDRAADLRPRPVLRPLHDVAPGRGEAVLAGPAGRRHPGRSGRAGVWFARQVRSRTPSSSARASRSAGSA